ncbi:MAG: type II toxin-antitoxin system RelE/ParE family toxin [Syntrophobacteraceae bacterium]
MAWRVELAPDAVKDLDRLDSKIAQRIIRFLHERVAVLDDPRTFGKALQGPRFGELWRYRVGDWRVICKIDDEIVTVLVLRISHRSKAYHP